MRVHPRDRGRRVVVVVVVACLSLVVIGHALRRGDATAAAVRIAPGATVHAIRPTQVDPSVTGPDNPSLAMAAPPSRSNGLLLVFLPGTGGQPGCCQLFLRAAASLGYHAIGLTYNNETAVGARCLNDLKCFGTVRRNEFDGAEPSALISLPPRDVIEHRLASLLSYLAARYPREGWRRFLVHRLPNWRLTVMSGHSQGGGEAAFIGTIKRLRGVVTLSSPPDTNLSDIAATWVTGVPHGRTPIDRIVTFVHSGDPFYPRIIADWKAMRLGSLGQLISVDSAAPPYRYTHELISSAPLPHVVLATHDSTAVDSATPSCPNGSAKYAPAWRYMLEVAAGLRSSRFRRMPACQSEGT